MLPVAQRGCACMNFNGHQSWLLSLCREARLDLKGTDVPHYATFTELMFSFFFFFFYNMSLQPISPLTRKVHPLLPSPGTRWSGNRPKRRSSSPVPVSVQLCHLRPPLFHPTLKTRGRPHQTYNSAGGKSPQEHCKHQAKYTVPDLLKKTIFRPRFIFFPNTCGRSNFTCGVLPES